MTSTGTRGVLLAAHLLAAIALLGPVIAAVGYSPRLARAGHEGIGGLRSARRTTQGYGYAGIVVFLLSGALAQPRYGYQLSQAWLGASMGLFLVGLGLVVRVMLPAQDAALTKMAERACAGWSSWS